MSEGSDVSRFVFSSFCGIFDNLTFIFSANTSSKPLDLTVGRSQEPFDNLSFFIPARFPNTNQTRHWYVSYQLRLIPLLQSVPCSFQNYTDYFKCIAAKGEDFAPCKQFKRAYNSLCPSMYFIYLA